MQKQKKSKLRLFGYPVQYKGDSKDDKMGKGHSTG